jgi:ubiquinol-cytochrome c reductase cytochrome c1 subunit
MKYLLYFLLLCSSPLFAEEKTIALEKVSINIHDTASIKRGASFFATNCMACHTMIYLRYDTLAKKAGVVYERMPINVKEWPFGIKPPDLSLEASVRGPDWIYTYLHSFYVDTSRPTGFNNLLFPNTAMSNILLAYQGPQERIKTTISSQWYDQLVLIHQGSMTPEQFDDTLKDVVNFLQYAAEPYQIKQHRIGFWALLFLFTFFILIYLLKREYWKDIKK